MRSLGESVAGFMAALYGDPSDPVFSAAALCVLSVDELRASLLIAVDHMHVDAAQVIYDEIRRLTGAHDDPHARSLAYGSSAGLWRVH